MIVDAIYYGRFQIQKVYQNGCIIWEGGKPAIRLELYGLSEIISEADGVGHTITDVCLYGISENESYANGLMRCCIILPATGLSETELYGDLLGRSLPAILAHGVGEIISDGNVKGRACSARIIATAEGIITDANAKGRAVRVAVMYVRTDTITQACGQGYSWKVIPITGVTTKEVAKADGITRAVSALLVSGIASGFDNDGTAKGILFPLVPLTGRGGAMSYDLGTLDYIPAYTMIGVSDTDSNCDGIIEITATSIGYGVSVIKNDAFAAGQMWFLPIEDGDILEVRQVYDYIEDGDILEVI